MASKKDSSTEEELSIDVTGSASPTKKHKKHKHKKHKRGKKELPKLDQDSDFEGDMKPTLKLKFKIGGRGVGDKSVAIIQAVGADEENQLIEVVEDVPPVSQNVESDISDEDAWLEALESGKLDEYSELKRMKDPALMTARQRALLESKSHRDVQLQEYVMLPTNYKEKEMTEEMIQKREMRAKKRRQQAQEKREKDKIQTIDRLLKKQETRSKVNKNKAAKKAEVPRFSYVKNAEGSTISVPVGLEFPLQRRNLSNVVPPVTVLCGAPGCRNPKKYSCSRTGVPLCSLECYKRNASISNLSAVKREMDL